MMGWWRRYLDWRQRNVVQLVLIAGGFEALSGGNRTRLFWNTIEKVTAYKRDIVTVDLLCLLVQSENVVIEINEEMKGYDAVEAALERSIDVPPEWKVDVLLPAFETNLTTIFDRAAVVA